MLSRVANSLFWAGRYIERAENYARFIDVNSNLALDLPPRLNEQWEPLITATGDLEQYTSRYQSFDREQAIYFLAFDLENPNSMFSALSNARENARTVRENLTKETWETLNGIYLKMKEGHKKEIWKKDHAAGFMIGVKFRIQLLYGIIYNSVARTEGWYWVTLGQYLERADKTSRILDVKYHYLLPSLEDVGTSLDYIHWMALLKSVSAFNTYRRFYGPIVPSSVVEFLVLNRKFPRSIFFCLSEAERCLHKISGRTDTSFSNKPEKLIGGLRSQLEYQEVEDVIDAGLHEYLDDFQIKLNAISDAVHETFFDIKDTFISQSINQ